MRIGHGSEVRIRGGRIIGGNQQDPQHRFGPGNIGVHITGNNGGVHVSATDVIAHYEGIRIDSSSGAGSNREIFLSTATIDSNYRGIVIDDHSYVSVSNLWAASSYDANILLTSNAAGAIFVAVGGTIFNAGAEGHGDVARGANGLVAYAGSFTLSGVLIRNNMGRGVWLPRPPGSEHSNSISGDAGCFSDGLGLPTQECVNATVAPQEWSVTGSRLYGNGVAVMVENPFSQAYLISSNVFGQNANTSNFGNVSRAGALVTNNIQR